jgi:hypothetical protein
LTGWPDAIGRNNKKSVVFGSLRSVEREFKEEGMAQSSGKKKPVGKMLFAGAISIALYAALLANQDVVNGHFGRGGMYAVLPIVTAFLFSFFHGAFTGHFWTVLGVEAAKKKKEVK